MVRDDVENKVANEGCKPEWNELLHMLERRLQRYSGAECRENELAHFYDRGEQADAEAVGVSVSKASVATKNCFCHDRAARTRA